MLLRALLATMLLASLAFSTPAAAYYHCFKDDIVCASYNWRVSDTYLDLESDYFMAGAGMHNDTGPFNGTNAYFFTPSTYAGVYDGEWHDGNSGARHNFTLVTVGVNGMRVLFFDMQARATEYPAAKHCLEVGPGPLYKRCGTGLP